MNDKLKNIFVPYEIAKLAYEKGFREWCAGMYHGGEICMNATKNNDPDFDYTDFNYDTGEYGLPTHFQLISWLKVNHNIDILGQNNRKYVVIGFCGYIYNNGSNEWEINEAIESALNILSDK